MSGKKVNQQQQSIEYKADIKPQLKTDDTEHQTISYGFSLGIPWNFKIHFRCPTKKAF